jgi:hypothetical protein
MIKTEGPRWRPRLVSPRAPGAPGHFSPSVPPPVLQLQPLVNERALVPFPPFPLPRIPARGPACLCSPRHCGPFFPPTAGAAFCPWWSPCWRVSHLSGRSARCSSRTLASTSGCPSSSAITHSSDDDDASCHHAASRPGEHNSHTLQLSMAPCSPAATRAHQALPYSPGPATVWIPN